MKKAFLLLVVLALAIGLIGYFRVARQPQVPVTYPIPEAPDTPGILYPIEGAAPKSEPATPVIDPEKPLPELRESDERIEDTLSRLFAGREIDKFFVLDNFIRRFVVMVDNLPRRNLPATHMPTKPVPGNFLVVGKDQNLEIDPANYRRYAPYIQLAEAVEPARLVAVYVRFYPLFQEAYRELGYPSGYFNDRLVEVIDHLLAVPEVSHPIRLAQPKIAYQYANPELESLSAGRKILIRMGPENAARVKSILRRYRRELTAASDRN
ncbi:DUF3014 domain-containing protein [Desulfuromonas sp. TF]|uniref:DUF3014 domain-containing protein n=1 Tax=Desulfuromonas sp. TF TaxID=1232410 RepID=UPI0004260570|nr:DUF3014 domain-containing protein [Desulfuromonas sp. TF]